MFSMRTSTAVGPDSQGPFDVRWTTRRKVGNTKPSKA